MSDKLTPKQQKFCEEYLVDFNGKQAAIRSGYSPKTAEVQGSTLLSYTKVKKFLNEKIEKRSEKADIDATWVLKKAAELTDRCMQEVKPKMVRKGGEMVQDEDEEGNKLFVFNAQGAAKGLEIVGKHVNVQAFRENMNMTGDMNFTVYTGVPASGGDKEGDDEEQ